MSTHTYRLDTLNPGCCYAAIGVVALGDLLRQDWSSYWATDSKRRMADFVTTAGPHDLLSLLAAADITGGDSPDSPVALVWGKASITIDWWRTGDKSFGGQASALTILRSAQFALRQAQQSEESWIDWHPFHYAAPMGSRLGLDTRSAVTSLDAGYTPGLHGEPIISYPAVELLSAIGYQVYRPLDGGHVYHLWQWPAASMIDLYRPPHMRTTSWYTERVICPARAWEWRQNGKAFRVASQAWPMDWDAPSKLFPRLDALPLDQQMAVLRTASRKAITQAHATTVAIGRRRKLSTCERCGVELSAREMQAHTRAKCDAELVARGIEPPLDVDEPQVMDS